MFIEPLSLLTAFTVSSNFGRVNYAWSVFTHDRSKDKFRVINQFLIIDHVVEIQIIETIFSIWYTLQGIMYTK